MNTSDNIVLEVALVIVLALVAVSLVAAIYSEIPALRRYLRMRRM